MCRVLLFAVLDYGQWLVLEPVMTVEVVAPAEFQGSVLGGLCKRHAVVTGQDATEGYFSVFCEVGSVVKDSMWAPELSEFPVIKCDLTKVLCFCVCLT